jgi:hypothetical protein
LRCQHEQQDTQREQQDERRQRARVRPGRDLRGGTRAEVAAQGRRDSGGAAAERPTARGGDELRDGAARSLWIGAVGATRPSVRRIQTIASTTDAHDHDVHAGRRGQRACDGTGIEGDALPVGDQQERAVPLRA